MESAMLYRAELLLGLYAVTAGICHAVPSLPMETVSLLVAILACWWSDVENVSVLVILSLVANAVHWLMCLGVTRIMVQKPPSLLSARGHFMLFILVFMLLQLLVASFGYIRNHSIRYLSLLPAIFVAFVLFLPLSTLLTASAHNPRNVSFLSLFLPIWPFLVVGKLFMIAWNVVSEFPEHNNMADLPRFLSLVCLPVYLRSIMYSRKEQHFTLTQQWILPCLYILAIVMLGPRMLQVGGGYVVGHFMSCVAWIDVMIAILIQLKAS